VDLYVGIAFFHFFRESDRFVLEERADRQLFYSLLRRELANRLPYESRAAQDQNFFTREFHIVSSLLDGQAIMPDVRWQQEKIMKKSGFKVRGAANKIL
jgi:hypothetical protein